MQFIRASFEGPCVGKVRTVSEHSGSPNVTEHLLTVRSRPSLTLGTAITSCQGEPRQTKKVTSQKLLGKLISRIAVTIPKIIIVMVKGKFLKQTFIKCPQLKNSAQLRLSSAWLSWVEIILSLCYGGEGITLFFS